MNLGSALQQSGTAGGNSGIHNRADTNLVSPLGPGSRRQRAGRHSPPLEVLEFWLKGGDLPVLFDHSCYQFGNEKLVSARSRDHRPQPGIYRYCSVRDSRTSHPCSSLPAVPTAWISTAGFPMQLGFYHPPPANGPQLQFAALGKIINGLESGGLHGSRQHWPGLVTLVRSLQQAQRSRPQRHLSLELQLNASYSDGDGSQLAESKPGANLVGFGHPQRPRDKQGS
ncbi:uncharacterized protein BDZ99DRAFT_481380 [Mytilinidion resinicola]|uniref:Uncharacterized protein n=1 Tax=Mytilinidion resinicola TaxID=574789 RepID=A0A6A6Y8S2_9PEZI|nr:uncharacterized protein BDZ99DRAFT_481380 [Mytilinidion resinicola]KAF2804217.1 hypothetical protein BDZ99DRAFT_481380 [Mytilinidion resinicola]